VRVRALLAWYERVRRPLPWRFTRDPYALLVSEVMLQQTQAGRVTGRWEAFLARFPDPVALAAAPARDVLAEWSGLGYNRRALALQAAAREVAARGWPDDLRSLPGVGPYTAAAVASFAWDAEVAAVDTNARRVIERWDGVARTPAALARRAADLLPAGRAAPFNQAIMELGATVCTARRPRCGECPVKAGCATRRAGGPGGGPPGRPRDGPAAGSLAPGRPRDARAAGSLAPGRPPRRREPPRALRGLRPVGAGADRRRARRRRAAAGARARAARPRPRRPRPRRPRRARRRRRRAAAVTVG
jgi:A/G-specific adenine glycosylase